VIRKRIALAMVLVLMTLAAAPLLASGSPGQATATAVFPQTPPDKAKAETIHPAPKNIKEKSAVYVFLVWLWLTIASLIYVFALKIREADRILSLLYYQPDKSPRRRRLRL
jgi:hypothetical protein